MSTGSGGESDAEEISVPVPNQPVRPIFAPGSSQAPKEQSTAMGARFWASVLVLGTVGLLVHLITRFLLAGNVSGPLGVLLLLFLTCFFVIWVQVHGTGLQTRRRAYFDEANILKTYQPRAKTMGHLFQPEPPTPGETAGQAPDPMKELASIKFEEAEREAAEPTNETQAFKAKRDAHYGGEFAMAQKLMAERADTEGTHKQPTGTVTFSEEDTKGATELKTESRKEFERLRAQHYANEFKFAKGKARGKEKKKQTEPQPEKEEDATDSKPETSNAVPPGDKTPEPDAQQEGEKPKQESVEDDKITPAEAETQREEESKANEESPAESSGAQVGELAAGTTEPETVKEEEPKSSEQTPAEPEVLKATEQEEPTPTEPVKTGESDDVNEQQKPKSDTEETTN